MYFISLSDPNDIYHEFEIERCRRRMKAGGQ